ncbi:hypothetical protein HBA55_23690 [Pseudomaricurvus alkylphenolicus]|uniref:hypothetical protein n=1 Tax=Pseudomaricurvus alkylphenolicus TaxID=1306991 RepID=UPI0014228213|nr:hypothetical protein [Pseudomaricurvus alkylphenolicus]NIB42630.1 hypothetical protein [Pseudomaricurvus alkylphenolicus]
MPNHYDDTRSITGEFVTLAGDRYYRISNVDQMTPFFISLVSDSDHWLFVSSNGGLTAGRISPETALFPYVTVDKIHESTHHTGSKTLIRVDSPDGSSLWEPFNQEHDHRYQVSRHIYKNTLGNKVLFEEINHDLQLAFRYQWSTSDEFGFVREVTLQNLDNNARTVDVIDGLQNLLPAGTPRFTQTNSSYLVDAYKWSELDADTGLATFSLFSAITDRAEPCESLRATTVFSLGLDNPTVLLSSEQLAAFRKQTPVGTERCKRGVRGAYLVQSTIDLPANGSSDWTLVANIEQTQKQAVGLQQDLQSANELQQAVEASVATGSDNLARIMAAADGFQLTAEENVSVHHYANVQFNLLRGGIFDNQYQISCKDFIETVELFNAPVAERHREALQALPENIDYNDLLARVQTWDDAQLERLSYEYLPITFGRRHGDPSRPWNQFAINLKNEQGEPLLSYQGNWRDIFQNWEALLLSYPEFTENVIAKFVNASTVDGYNPYRITKQGIDWEVEDPEDPWSYIGYWGDHQIIYLQKLLELSQQFHPQALQSLLTRPVFSYANVPYRIKPFAALLENAKDTVTFDDELAAKIEQRVEQLGADGKLLLSSDGDVVQVNLLEKLLVPLLSKLGNLVVDGGIWMNTQRPEWNDANNALVGQGLSMVTLCYMRRYVTFLNDLIGDDTDSFSLSKEVNQWLLETSAALQNMRHHLGNGPVTQQVRFELLQQLGLAADRYRQTVYQQAGFSGCDVQEKTVVSQLLDDALAAIDHTIQTNLRTDGLYHAYNLLDINSETTLDVDTLYPMLEGQVAALSSGAIAPGDAADILETLFGSDLFRTDQKTFLLYPDRELPGFLDKNRIAAETIADMPLLKDMVAQGDARLLEQDANGCYRFNAGLTNADALNQTIDELLPRYGESLEALRQPLQALYEQVFNHKAFTGRSGGMFAFEGLGSIYWHMVSKVLLAAQECFYQAATQGCDSAQRLGELYYKVREGIGFNKTPEEYGAFPTDPYSHTPAHMGAQQPGMTGQVKEEVLTRFGELGIAVKDGCAQINPVLLREREFIKEAAAFRYLNVRNQWSEVSVSENGLAFTWCQVPLVYQLVDDEPAGITVHWRDSKPATQLDSLALPQEITDKIFRHSGEVESIEVRLTRTQLFSA